MTAGDLEKAHGAILSRNDLLDRRRALYSAAIAFLNQSGVEDPDAAVLDNPLVRAAVGRGLGGSVGEVSADPLWALAPEPGAFGVRVASERGAAAALAPVLAHVADQVLDHGDRVRLEVLTRDSPEFADSVSTIAAGAALLHEVVPELARDVLPHVGLVTVLSGGGRLGSASLREYPGLVMLPPPGSALEAAEALIHEGAHQKFFDLAIVGSIFASRPASGLLRPSWVAGSAPGWTFAQCAAAFHAYCHLAVLAGPTRSFEVHDGSLLPFAAERAAELGEMLQDRQALLGKDGRLLVGSLVGNELSDVVVEDAPLSTSPWRDDPRAVTRAVGEWSVVVYGVGPSVVRLAPPARRG
ncbi:aKG-HExxH-type peptide beta-hydroxylase [Pseudonocardia pini]|uniref:aKG-HExxH-type peptide beta-hydroxylase n=1 Tax=Pseudonocardia pini TaxID=2758030 RepID=UPI0015F106D9|nr:HEXXH motif-containing putative peptide modification protein [Pseudonocardia pini]